MRLANSLLASFGVAGIFLSCGVLTTDTAAAPPAPMPAAAAGFGTIKGKLVWGGKDVPKPAEIDSNKGAEFCKDLTLADQGLVIDPATKGVSDAFVYLATPKGKNPEAEKAKVEKDATLVIDNKNCEFVPTSTALLKGQTLQFKSQDPVGHNSHWTGFTNSGNLVLIPKGQTPPQKLQAEKNLINLNCDIHPWMHGYIMVFDHPFFAVTGKDGSFEITGVPAGAQNLVVRQGKVGFVTPNQAKGIAVEVKADAVTDVGEIVLDPAKLKK